MASDAALFAEARAASPEAVGTFLAAAGFADIGKDELLVLGALALSTRHGAGPSGAPGAGPPGGPAESLLAGQLGLPEPEVSRHIAALARHGYLEPPAAPGSPDGPPPRITGRGQAAITAAADGITSTRWTDFASRPGDIVISTLPRSGTTWMQMICALLIFQDPELPAPLQQLSPWLEEPNTSRGELYARLDSLRHRRFIKTHLSLQELSVRPEVTYIVVARHPLDTAVSMYHGNRVGPAPVPLREWLLEWSRSATMGSSLQAARNSLPAAIRFLSSAWEHRGPNVLLVRYEDLRADLAGQMRKLAAQLDITVPEPRWPGLAGAATFEQMRAAGSRMVNGSTDPAAFFRRGTSGSGRELLPAADLAAYHERVSQLAPPGLAAWLDPDQAAR